MHHDGRVESLDVLRGVAVRHAYHEADDVSVLWKYWGPRPFLRFIDRAWRRALPSYRASVPLGCGQNGFLLTPT